MKIKNPIVNGFYADPEARYYEGAYWIYVTNSYTEYDKQQNLTVFRSIDLKHWEKYENIIDMQGFPWVHKAVWAPTIIEKEGNYYLIFASNDIQSNAEYGGLEIAVAKHPQGPFKAILKHPLIDRFIAKAQPIDAHLFKDDDGTIYLYYGGWKHCNMARINEYMNGFVPFDNGEIYLSMTPPEYVESPCMLKKDNLYYFIWSAGDWVNGSYCVHYGVSNCAQGPFEDCGIILKSDGIIAEGPGHPGFLKLVNSDDYLLVYHRRIIQDNEAGHRVLCMDHLHVHDGKIEPIQMSDEFSLY